MIVLGHRVDETGSRTTSLASEVMAAFATAPAVVATLHDDVDLLPVTLADVTEPQLATLLVETPAPRIAHAVRVDFWAGLRIGRGTALWIGAKRIGRGNRIGRRGFDGANVDAQNLAEHRRKRLAVANRAVLRVWIAAAAAVAKSNVEKSIRTKCDVAAVVIRLRLIERQQDALGSRIERQAAIERQE